MAQVAASELDLVYSREKETLARLEQVLRELKACYRMKPEITPDARRLDGSGHHQLQTMFGPLDLLGSTFEGKAFPDLIGHTEDFDLGLGKAVQILDLPTLIKIKETLARDRDLAVLPILKRILKERGGA